MAESNITRPPSYVPVMEVKTFTTDNNGYAAIGLQWTKYIISLIVSSPNPGQNEIKVNLFTLNNFWYGEFKDALTNNPISGTEITMNILHT